METQLTSTQAAKLLFVSAETLRRWEAEGKIKSTRTAGGHRRYKKTDVETLGRNLSASKIQTAVEDYSFASHIRKRPGMYVGSVKQRGLMVLFEAVLRRAVSSYDENKCQRIDVSIQDNQVSITEHGASIASPDNQQLMLLATTHGKYREDHRYVENPFNLVNVNALSKTFSIDSFDGTMHRHIEFFQGKVIRPESATSSTDPARTTVCWAIDETIFQDVAYNCQEIENKLQTFSKLCPLLEINFSYQTTKTLQEDHVYNYSSSSVYQNQTKETHQKRFLSKNGLQDVIASSDSVCKEPLMFHSVFEYADDYEKQEVQMDFGFDWCQSQEATMTVYANRYESLSGGTAKEGLDLGLVQAFNHIGRKRGYITNPVDYMQRTDGLEELAWRTSLHAGDAFAYQDVTGSLQSLISIKMPSPQYEGQFGHDLAVPFEKQIQENVFLALVDFLENPANKETSDLVLELVLGNRNQRLTRDEKRKAGSKKNHQNFFQRVLSRF